MEDRAAGIIQGIEDTWERLTIKDDFVFCKAMLDEDLCREVLEAILHIHIERLEYLGQQEPIDLTPQTKGIRLDVYVRDDQGTVFNVEMQAVNTRELPQRARYYQSLMTLHQLERGLPYRDLRGAYVIFVCDFDLFGKGRRVYSFQNRCDEDGALALGDGARTVFLSAASPTDKAAGDRVNEFLDYVASGNVRGELSSHLDKAVEHVLDNTEWRLEYMMLAVRDQLNVDKGREIGLQLGIEQGKAAGLAEGIEQGKAEGLAQGIEQGKATGLAEGIEQGKAAGLAQGIERGKAAGLAEGIEQGKAEGLAEGIEQGKAAGLAEGIEQGKAAGEDRFARLVGALLTAGRAEDAARSASDAALRGRLYEELGIS